MKVTINQNVVSITSTKEENKGEVLKTYETARKPKLSNVAKKTIDELGHMDFDVEITTKSTTYEMDRETFIEHATLVEDVEEA